MSSHEAYCEQLALFTSRPSFSQLPTPESDPYWDEITKKSAHEHTDDKWNPADFGETPFKADNEQLTIFYDDSHEPPDPDDFNSIEEFEEAWSKWESVREQVTYTTQETAHEHIDNNSSVVTSTTSLLSNTGVREQTMQGFEVAHEHIDVSSESVAITTTDLLDTGESLPNNFVNGSNSHQQPTQKQPTHWVEKYWVETASKKHWYYRYVYMTGRRQHRTHIGSTSSKAAIQKRADVLWMIEDDVAPEEIISFIKGG